MAEPDVKPYWGDEHKPFVRAWREDSEPETESSPPTLAELADAIVRGASVCHAIIPEFRTLIEAVQDNSDVRLIARGRDGTRAIDEPTALHINGGEVNSGACENSEISVDLVVKTLFIDIADFSATQFNGDANFGTARFSRAADFRNARFADQASFLLATFASGVSFKEATFARESFFGGATMSRTADFNGATFQGKADFFNATFTGIVRFDSTFFASVATFFRTRFPNRSHFQSADFAGGVNFHAVDLTQADLSRANLARAKFYRAKLIGATLIKANAEGAQYELADVSSMRVSEARLINTHGLFGKNRALARTAPIEEHEAQNAIYCRKYDFAAWDRLRAITTLRLFAVSYLSIIAIAMFATFGRRYNAFAVHVRNSARSRMEAPSGAETPLFWLKVLAHLPDLPMPGHLGRQLLATIILAIAATIYALWCPSEVKEASEVRWTRAINQPLWEYRAANWSRIGARYSCAICFAVGGGYSAYYLVWRTAVALKYLLIG